MLDGELPLEPVFASDYMFAYRENCADTKNYISAHKWHRQFNSRVFETEVTAAEMANGVSSLVSFGADGVVLNFLQNREVWHFSTTGTKTVLAAAKIKFTDDAAE